MNAWLHIMIAIKVQYIKLYQKNTIHCGWANDDSKPMPQAPDLFVLWIIDNNVFIRLFILTSYCLETRQ